MFAVLGLEGKPPHKPARSSPYVGEDLIQINRPAPMITVHSPPAASGAAENDKTLAKVQRLLRIKNGPGVEDFVAQKSGGGGACG